MYPKNHIFGTSRRSTKIKAGMYPLPKMHSSVMGRCQREGNCPSSTWDECSCHTTPQNKSVNANGVQTKPAYDSSSAVFLVVLLGSVFALSCSMLLTKFGGEPGSFASTIRGKVAGLTQPFSGPRTQASALTKPSICFFCPFNCPWAISHPTSGYLI